MCWLVEARPREPIRCEVQIRYRSAPVSATVEPLAEDGSSAMVRFEDPVRAVTPGQAAVFYRGHELIGGGWIHHALSRASRHRRI